MSNNYVSRGGDINPTIDHRAYPFESAMTVPLTIKEQRVESYPTVSNLSVANVPNARLEFNITSVSDFSMYDLHNSFFQFKLQVPDISGQNIGISQFGSNNMITDCQVYFGSVLVSESHPSTYPQSAFVKDILLQKRPCVPSIASAFNTNCSGQLTENFLEEGEYLSYPLSTTATANASTTGSLAFTSAYMSNKQICVSVRLKDGIFMTSKFFPANMNLKIVLQTNLNNFFQENPASAIISGGGVAVNSASFLLNRVFLSEESQKAQNMALLHSPFKYVLPYAKTETKLIQTGASSANITSLFQGQTKPDLVAIFFQYPITKAQPLTVCGGLDSAPKVQSLFLKWNGQQYPAPTSDPLSTDIRTYREYVKQCLNDSEDVYLDYLHWLNHYTVYCVSLRDDQEKMYGLLSSDQTGGIELNVTFQAQLTSNATMFAVALTHSRLEISDRVIINKYGYSN